MRENRRYVITAAGEKQYITDADVKTEQYCDECEAVIQGPEETIYLNIRGGWQDGHRSIPSHHAVLVLHEHCCPAQIRALMTEPPVDVQR